MLREITIGQFYPADSAIHRLDPRVKLAGTFVFLVSLFITKSITGYIIATAALAICIRLSTVPFKFITRGLKAILFVLLISVSFNLFLTPGELLFKIGFLRFTREGLKTAGFMAVRLIYLVIGSSIMTLCG